MLLVSAAPLPILRTRESSAVSVRLAVRCPLPRTGLGTGSPGSGQSEE